MRTLLAAIGVFILALTAAAGPAAASRAAIDSRALPRELALDPSLAFTNPGSVGSLDPQILVDYDVVLALGGRALRYGYLDDGGTHALVLASPRGWGLSVGFRDRYSSDKEFNESTSGGYFVDEQLSAERTFLVNVGAQRRAGSGRSYELAVGGVVFQGEQGTEVRDYRDSEEPAVYSFRWKSDPGLGGTLRLRTITAEPGPQFAASGSYMDRRPKGNVPAGVAYIDRVFSAALGWRLAYPGLDEFMIGTGASWSDIENFTIYGSTSVEVRRAHDRTFTGRVFVSGERRVLPSLVLRAGATALITDARHAGQTLYFNETTSYRSEYTDERHTRNLGSPGVSVGAGWSHEPFTFDAQATSSLTFDYLIARWALTFKLQ